MVEDVVVLTRKTLVTGDTPASFSMPQEISEELRTSGYRALHGVICHYHEGTAILQGRVPSFYMKQLAQALAGKVSGVKLVVNRLTVD